MTDRLTLRDLLVTLGVILLCLVAWLLADALLVLFSGVLWGIFLSRSSKALQRLVPQLTHLSAYIIVLAILVMLTLLFIHYIVPQIAEQGRLFAEQIPRSFERLQGMISDYNWLWEPYIDSDTTSTISDWTTRITSILWTATSIAGVVINGTALAIVAFLFGTYVAYKPSIYLNGMLRLVPPPRRQRMRQVQETIGNTLWLWLLGRLIAMFAVGILTWIGLWFLDMPIAFGLAMVAGLLSFIPNFGPIFAAVPALLLALLQDPIYLLYVPLLYMAVQAIEGNLITPVVESRMISMPAGVIIASQVMFGLLLGTMGVLLATPFTVCIIVITQMLYIEDVLGDPVLHLRGGTPRQR